MTFDAASADGTEGVLDPDEKNLDPFMIMT